MATFVNLILQAAIGYLFRSNNVVSYFLVKSAIRAYDNFPDKETLYNFNKLPNKCRKKRWQFNQNSFT